MKFPEHTLPWSLPGQNIALTRRWRRPVKPAVPAKQRRRITKAERKANGRAYNAVDRPRSNDTPAILLPQAVDGGVNAIRGAASPPDRSLKFFDRDHDLMKGCDNYERAFRIAAVRRERVPEQAKKPRFSVRAHEKNAVTAPLCAAVVRALYEAATVALVSRSLAMRLAHGSSTRDRAYGCVTRRLALTWHRAAQRRRTSYVARTGPDDACAVYLRCPHEQATITRETRGPPRKARVYASHGGAPDAFSSRPQDRRQRRRPRACARCRTRTAS